MAYCMLSWDEPNNKYCESRTAHESLENVLESYATIFDEDRIMTCCLLAVPSATRYPRISEAKENSSIRFKSFLDSLRRDYIYLCDDGTKRDGEAARIWQSWGDGYTDISHIPDLHSLISKIVSRCYQAPVSVVWNSELDAWFESDNFKNVPLQSVCERVNPLFAPRQPANHEKYAHLFIISETCYNEIKKSKTKLPDIIACVVKYELNLSPRELLDQRYEWFKEKYKDEPEYLNVIEGDISFLKEGLQSGGISLDPNDLINLIFNLDNKWMKLPENPIKDRQ